MRALIWIAGIVWYSTSITCQYNVWVGYKYLGTVCKQSDNPAWGWLLFFCMAALVIEFFVWAKKRVDRKEVK